MSPRRCAPDANQADIVRGLRCIPGVSVKVVSTVPKMLDLLVGSRDAEGIPRTYWYEIKVGPSAPVTKAEREILDTWAGHAKLVCSIDEILVDMGLEKWSEHWELRVRDRRPD